MPRPRKHAAPTRDAQTYRHPEADLAARPEIGTQAHFKKAKAPASYRYDSALAPELCWDGQNPGRETAERLIAEIADCGLRIADLAKLPASKQRDSEIANLKSEIADARRRLRGLSGPFLNWSGKAERLSFDVPTLPLFVHERLSTKAILETLKGHRREKQDDFLNNLFACHDRPLADQVLRAYEHRDRWVNRLILGDSLVVMNSLLRFESLGGQVQTIYVDPPYGVKFGSNFQPFIRKRDVKHNEDDDLTREPEMVQAYRDTWELGLHSYLTYLRDRLLLARELLAPTGSIFVQISDENLHHVREVMDEVFGAENCVCIITVQKAPYATSSTLPVVADFLCWYAKHKEKVKYRQLFKPKADLDSLDLYRLALSTDTKTHRPLTREESETGVMEEGWKRYRLVSLVSPGAARQQTPTGR
ncbi:MAG: site-specific DNA-methyltransferase [Verrucomicrobia bacterium]|nr:site-specific DNA-methyltransferase [Verrucomicrobiota bacterium]